MNCQIVVKKNPNVKVKSKKTKSTSKNAFFIEGGGTKGIYGLGILKYLFDDTEKYFNIEDVEIFGGTSVGSYFALALSIGYNSADIDSLVDELDLSGLIDSKFMLPITILRFLKSSHLYNDTGRLQIIKKIINRKITDICTDLGKNIVADDFTLGDLRTLIENDNKKYTHLIVNCVDISRSDQIFFTTLENKYDNIKIIDILLASSSIPFVWSPVKLYEDSNGIYTYTKDPAYTVHLLIDGATSTNNPLDYFLLNDDKYANYNLWLMRFSKVPDYVNINSTFKLITQLFEYLISEKNDTKLELLEDQFKLNIVDLYITESALKLYTTDEMKTIVIEMYQKCIDSDITFN